MGKGTDTIFSAVTLLINNHGPHIYEKFFGLNKLGLAKHTLYLVESKGLTAIGADEVDWCPGLEDVAAFSACVRAV